MSRADDHASEVYVPAGRHQARAALHAQLAREHEAVADSLTEFHAPMCGGMEAQTLVVCPLLGPIVSVEDIEDGIELSVRREINWPSCADPSPLAALLVAHIPPVCSLLAPCERGASTQEGDQFIFRRTLTLAESVDRDRLLARIQCHVSFAGAGRAGSIHQCPLYLEGVSAAAGQDDHHILLETNDVGDVEQLRREVRQHLPDDQ